MIATTYRLGDVAEFVRGVTYKPADVLSSTHSHSIPCFRTANIQNYLEDKDLVYILQDRTKAWKRIREGDILVSSANSWNLVGKCCWIPKLNYEATFGGFTSVLRTDLTKVVPRYVYHWFASTDIQSLARSFSNQTTNISNLSLARCLDLEIPLPPLDEQRRIAAILDQADALRRKRKRTLDLLEALEKAVFIEVFVDDDPKWLLRTVGNISLNVRTGPFGSQLLHSEFTDSGIAVLGIDNAVSNTFKWGERRFISSEKYQQLRRYTVLPSDVLVTIMGTCGRCAIVPNNIEKAINTKHICCITLNEKDCLPEYFQAAFLRHPAILKQLGVQAKGAVMPGLNMGIIKALELPVPPIKHQHIFARQITNLNAMRNIAEHAVRIIEALFTSLQHRAFSGQL